MLIKLRRPEVTEKMLAKAALYPSKRFAFLPTRLHDGNWIWLERYVRAPIQLYAACGKLKQFRVGGGWDDDGEYFPHRNFRQGDNSYLTVENSEDKEFNSIEFLFKKVRA